MMNRRILLLYFFIPLVTNAQIFLNQTGYHSKASKICLVPNGENFPFFIMNAQTGELEFEGKMEKTIDSMGAFGRGDFSVFAKPGLYHIVINKPVVYTSVPFEISDNIFDDGMKDILAYFQKQRCGNTTLNYLGKSCHLDDSFNRADSSHFDCTGGWHDASDLRKWIDATSFGMHGLMAILKLQSDLNKGEIIEELLWGSQYFLKMQAESGLWMNAPHFRENTRKENVFTDNIPDNLDDRLLDVRNASVSSQFRLVYALAGLAQIPGVEKVYAKTLSSAAKKAFIIANTQKLATTPNDFGCAVLAGIELNNFTGDIQYLNLAAGFADSIVALQVNTNGGSVHGYFWESAKRENYFRHIFDTDMFLIALCEICKNYPAHKNVESWKKSIENYCDGYLKTISGKNSFSLMPYGIYKNQPPGGRPIDSVYYRLTMFQGDYRTHQPSTNVSNWFVGINANITSKAVGLVKSAKLLNRNDYAVLAQRQLDWIMGFNPLGKSTMTGQGEIQAEHYAGGQPFPKTPLLKGGVRNGFTGNEKDEIIEMPGRWQTSEYWTPMVGMTAWLMAELDSFYKGNK
jgi:hypothetical protein